MLKGLTRQKALEILSIWKTAINQNNIYGFGLSRNLFNRAPVYKLYDEKFELKGIYDNNEALWGQRILVTEILSPKTLSASEEKKYVVFATDYQSVKNQLQKAGLRELIDFISVGDFWPLLCFYKYNKLYSGLTQCIVLSDRCNFKCEFCGAKVPVRTKPMGHRPLEAVEKDLAILFSHIDQFALFASGVGEPFIYPELAGFLDLVGKKYRHQIGHFFMATNASVIPERPVLEKLRQYRVTVNISDYSEAGISGYVEKMYKLCETLGKESISFNVVDEKWHENYIAPGEPLPVTHQGGVAAHYKKCANPCTAYIDGLYYPCSYSFTYKAIGAIGGRSEIDALNFKTLDVNDHDDRLRILMSLLGWHSEPSLEACRVCRGRGPDMEKVWVPKATQLSGRKPTGNCWTRRNQIN